MGMIGYFFGLYLYFEIWDSKIEKLINLFLFGLDVFDICRFCMY